MLFCGRHFGAGREQAVSGITLAGRDLAAAGARPQGERGFSTRNGTKTVRLAAPSEPAPRHKLGRDNDSDADDSRRRDNTGARSVMCIKVLRGSKPPLRQRRHDVDQGVVDQGGRAAGPCQEGRGLLGGGRAHGKRLRRRDGSAIKFDSNAAVLPQQQAGADRHPHLRPGDARAAHRSASCEDRVAGAGSSVRERAMEGIAQGRRGRRHLGKDKGKRGVVLARVDATARDASRRRRRRQEATLRPEPE